LQGNSYLKCINKECGLEYPIDSTNVHCEKGHLLDVKYRKNPSRALKELFYSRRNPQGSIFNESGVWRFRELLNFCQIDTGNLEECSKYLVSLDGAEGRQSKPYRMSKVAEFTKLNSENLWLQPEGFNPSGSFKDNGMAAAVTHAKLVNAKKIATELIEANEEIIEFNKRLVQYYKNLADTWVVAQKKVNAKVSKVKMDAETVSEWDLETGD